MRKTSTAVKYEHNATLFSEWFPNLEHKTRCTASATEHLRQPASPDRQQAASSCFHNSTFVKIAPSFANSNLVSFGPLEPNRICNRQKFSHKWNRKLCLLQLCSSFQTAEGYFHCSTQYLPSSGLAAETSWGNFTSRKLWHSMMACGTHYAELLLHAH